MRVVLLVAWVSCAWARETKSQREVVPGSEVGVSSPGYPAFMDRGLTHVVTVTSVPGAVLTLTCHVTQVDGSCDNSMVYIMLSNGSIFDTVCDSKTYTARVDDSSIQLKMAAFSMNQVKAKCSGAASMEGRSVPEYLQQEFEDEDVNSKEYGNKDLPSKKKTSCPCGWANKPRSRGRIVGGSETSPGEHPWAAAVVERIRSIDDHFHFCTGSVVTQRHVLTAGHCMKNYAPGWRRGDRADLAVIVGGHDLYSDKTEGRQMVGVVDMTVHERYTQAQDTHYDVAVLTTQRMVFSDRVGPVCLPDGPLRPDVVKAVGWGQTGKMEDLSPVPKKTWLKVLPLETCHPMYKPYNVVRLEEPRQLCIFGRNRGLCMGDSGGPVVWLDPESNRYVQVGVSTHSLGCSSFYPDVALDLSKTLAWLRQAINDTSATTCQRLP